VLAPAINVVAMDIIAISALALLQMLQLSGWQRCCRCGNVVIVGVNPALVPSSRRHCSRRPCAVAIVVVAALASSWT
jgi:hypothetical protein